MLQMRQSSSFLEKAGVFLQCCSVTVPETIWKPFLAANVRLSRAQDQMGDFSLISFLEGTGRDNAGRSLIDVLAFNDREIEARHDFIQWLFPLPERSAAVPSSPILSAEELEKIRESQTAQENLNRSVDRMLLFYKTTNHWLTHFDHNHLRITRIIKSLKLLSGETAARRFWEEVTQIVAKSNAPVNAESRAYWRNAALVCSETRPGL